MKQIKSFVLVLLIIVSLLALFVKLTSFPVLQFLGVDMRSGIEVTAQVPAQVYLNGQNFGTTPLRNDNLTEGRYRVRLESDSGSWQSEIKLVRGMTTVINRQLTKTPDDSAGEVLVLEHSHTGAIITSLPNQAEVDIDGNIAGKTPLSIYSLAQGEHTFTISKSGYTSRSLKVTIPENSTLNLDVKLSVIDTKIPPPEPLFSESKVKVLSNSVGFLRVRKEPSLSSLEIGRVDIGEELPYLGEEGEWVKVRLSDSREGYVHSAYLKKMF